MTYHTHRGFWQFSSRSRGREVPEQPAKSRLGEASLVSITQRLGARTDNRARSGHRRSGHRRSGHRRSGHRRSGHRRSGHRRSGHRRSGHWRSGHRRSGHRRSGHRRSGHRRSGHWRSRPTLRTLASRQPAYHRLIYSTTTRLILLTIRGF